MSLNCLTQKQQSRKFLNFRSHAISENIKTRYTITRLRRLSLVRSHVRGWYKLQRVGGWGGDGGDVWLPYKDWGGCEQGSVCDIWSGSAAQKCFEGVHTFVEALSGSVCLSKEPEVHVETRCLSSCLDMHRIGRGGPPGFPAKKMRLLRDITIFTQQVSIL